MAEGFYVTNTGIREIALAVNKGEKIDINSVAVGTGGDYEGDRDYTISELKHQVYTKDFDMYDHYDIDEHYENTICIEFTIPDDAGVIENINEVGFFDTEEHLIVYGVLQDIDKRVGTAGNLYRVTIVAYMPFTNDDLEYINLVIGTDALRDLERRTNTLESEMDTAQQDIISTNNELDKYVLKEDGRGLSTNDFDNIQKNQIQTNKDDISNIKKDLQKRPDSNTIDNLSKRVTTNENNIKTLQTDVSGKASQNSLDNLKSTVTSLTSTVNGKASNTTVNNLTTRVSANENDIKNLRIAIGNKADQEFALGILEYVRGEYIKEQIETNTKNINALSLSQSGKASQTDLTALTRRVSAIESELNGLASTLEALI